MKQCPTCQTTYTDETLLFCLADGTPLSEIAEEVTFVRSGRSDPMRVDIPQTAPPPSYVKQPPAELGSNTMKIVLVVGLLGAMAVIAVGGAAALIYFNKDSRTAEPVANTKGTPTPSSTSTPDNTNELRDQIANLEKRLNEQKNANKASATPPLVMPSPSTTRTSATVNSPGDGFLALRSLPNSEAGARILKIPHGATVSIGGCGPVVRPVSRSGRWCQASYNGYTGWVFDAYLVY
ncbi:MAG: SH3 domain-containing protein [Pyrinomonadaceae bacterium]|nr:SH3 domain-containing protein [Pyrinomonadaceae bacterium]